VFTVLTLISGGGAGIVAYLALWLLVPTQSAVGAGAGETAKQGAEELRVKVEQGADGVRGKYRRWRGKEDTATDVPPVATVDGSASPAATAPLPSSTLGPTPDSTPGPTPDSTPGPTPDSTPGPTPDSTPGPTPDSTPSHTTPPATSDLDPERGEDPTVRSSGEDGPAATAH
jgi:hypothetical protein